MDSVPVGAPLRGPRVPEKTICARFVKVWMTLIPLAQFPKMGLALTPTGEFPRGMAEVLGRV